VTPDYRQDPVAFIDANIPRNEKGERWTLSRHQRRVLAHGFRWDAQGRLTIRTFVWSEMKKSGKTFLAACLALWWSFVTPYTEVIAAANDFEQSVGRVFATIIKLLEHNPVLGRSATIRAASILLTNSTTITAIASDYKGAAGSRHSLAIFDELWGYSLEASQRLYEELTPPPSEPNAWLLVVTYAGWSGESVLLERLYQQGLAGERVDIELECYRHDELFMFWSHTPRQPWQSERYYNEQRRSLRPTTFARLHENKWVNAESCFLTAELVDACLERQHRPCLPDKTLELFVGVDASTKGDTAAVVALARDGDRYVLVHHRIWQPSAAAPLDLEGTIESDLLDLARDFTVRRGEVDPFQMHRSLMTLRAAGVPMHEFPQTQSNTVRMGQVLFDTIKGRNLVLYPDPELRQHLLNCVALETPRGFRLAKEKASKKIDGAVALAMALCAATEAPVRGPFAFTCAGQTISMSDPVEPTVVGRVMEQTADLSMRVVDGVRNVGQRLRSAITHTVERVDHTLEAVTREPQVQPTSDGHTRTIPEIRMLRRSRRSPAEQSRLDSFCESQVPQTDVEASIRRTGAWWPGDSLPTADLIAQKFQRWR
jgi:phage terminase large subunit-like protein